MTAGFIERGHRVVGCSRSSSVIDQMRKVYPSPHRFDSVDVSDDDSVACWAQSVMQDFSIPDLIVNNAALMNANNELWRVPPKEFSQLMDVNIKGVYHIIRHFVPAMISQQMGIIVNVSSGWGRSTSPEVAPYCATKWAVEGLTRAFADELPRGLAVVSLNPGVIHTEMLESCFGSSAKNYPSPVRWAERAIPFLLEISPDDNGQALTVP